MQCPMRGLAWQGADACACAARRYLFVAAMVASSVLIRRYHQRGVTKAAPTMIRWGLIVAFSIGAGCSRAVRVWATRDPAPARHVPPRLARHMSLILSWNCHTWPVQPVPLHASEFLQCSHLSYLWHLGSEATRCRPVTNNAASAAAAFAACYKGWPHNKPLKWVALLVFAIALIVVCSSFFFMKQARAPQPL